MKPSAERAGSARGSPAGITPDRLQRARAFAAWLATRHEHVLPIFERLDAEGAALDARAEAMERARRIAGERLR